LSYRSNNPSGAEPESDAQRQFNYMLQMEKLQRELDDRSRADFLKSNPFYDGPFDPGMAAAYYGMQTEMESQRKAMLLTNAQRGDMNSIREYAAMHDGLIHYEGAEARALFTNLYAMEAAKFRRRVPGAPTPSGGAQQGGPGEEASNSLYTLRSDYTRMKHLLGEFLSGEGPERSLFYGSHPLTKGMMNSAIVKRAKEWYAANGNGQDMVRRHFDFFATDVPFVSSDIEQFVGSARVSIYPRDGLTLFVIDNTTGRYSGGFDSVPDIHRVPGQITPTGNIYQRFIWIEWK